MKNYLITLLSLLMLTACGHILGNKNDNKNMNTIEFIPAIFENIDLESVETEMCQCSPGFPQEIIEADKLLNTLQINTPEKIFYRPSDNKFTPILPLCVAHLKSSLRILKYHDFPEITIFLKSENGKLKYSGNYFDKSKVNKTPLDMNSLLTAEELQYQQQEIEKAQKLTDEELDRDIYSDNIMNTYSGGYLNVNALDFVRIPIQSGKYEVWVTYYGMESNHAIVDITVEGDIKVLYNEELQTETPNVDPSIEEEDLPAI